MCALDRDDPKDVRTLAEAIGSYVGALKVGPRTVLRAEKNFIRDLSEIAPVFLDFKFFDIPSTMESSVRAAFDLGATFVTVHALSGREALERLSKLEAELSQVRPFHILAVTVLTSVGADTLPDIFESSDIHKNVMGLAKLANESGINGLVCSPHEVESIKTAYSDMKIVTPGIRPEFSTSNDQKRITTPKEALRMGADGLVIGRPIIEAESPIGAIEEICAEINR